MKRALLLALGLLAACGLGWGEIEVSIDEPEGDPLVYEYQGGEVQITFHGTVTGLGDHTYQYWWTWDGGQTTKTGFTADPLHVQITRPFGLGEHYMALEVTDDGVNVPGASKQVWVYKLEITQPQGARPAHQYTFGSDHDPGDKVYIDTQGTIHLPGQDASLWWWLMDMDGCGPTCQPPNAGGPTVQWKYQPLPQSNDVLGWKGITLHHPLCPPNEWAESYVEVFFPKYATNNPGGGDPNWYYYWDQTSAGAGEGTAAHTYRGNADMTGYTTWVAGAWVSYIDASACEGPAGNGQIWGAATGIDLFACICRHEAQHLADFSQWWPNGYVAADDQPDGDLLPTAFEEASDGLYDPALPATNDDTFGYNQGGGPLLDMEHYCLSHQAPWVNGSANAEDWASPGAQFGAMQ